MKTLIRHRKNIRALARRRGLAPLAFATLAALLLTPATVSAQNDREWNVSGSGNWTTDGNWFDGIPPNDTHGASIISGTAYILTGESGTAFNVKTSSADGSDVIGTVHIETGGTLTVMENIHVGSSGTGALTLESGAFVSATNGTILFGEDAGAEGILNLHGGTIATQGFAKGDDSATATLNLNGGVIHAVADLLVSSGTDDFFRNIGDITINGNDITDGSGTAGLTLSIAADTHITATNNFHFTTATATEYTHLALEKRGEGTLTLSGNSDLGEGDIIVSEGTLELTGALQNRDTLLTNKDPSKETKISLAGSAIWESTGNFNVGSNQYSPGALTLELLENATLNVGGELFLGQNGTLHTVGSSLQTITVGSFRSQGGSVNAEGDLVLNANSDVTLEDGSSFSLSGGIEITSDNGSITSENTSIDAQGSVILNAGNGYDSHIQLIAPVTSRAGDIEINANAQYSRIETQDLHAAGSIHLNAGSDITLGGPLNANQGMINITSEYGMIHAGAMEAQNEILLNANSDITLNEFITSQNGHIKATSQNGSINVTAALSAGAAISLNAESGDIHIANTIDSRGLTIRTPGTLWLESAATLVLRSDSTPLPDFNRIEASTIDFSASNLIFDLTGVAHGNSEREPILNLTLASASGNAELNIRNDYGELTHGIYTLITTNGFNILSNLSAPLFNGELRSSRHTNALLLKYDAGSSSVLLKAADTAGDLDLVWTGNESNIWTNNTAAEIRNWREAGDDYNFGLPFQNNDRVRFDDTATGTTDVDIDGPVQVDAITVDTSTNTYTFKGDGSITGTGANVAFVKSGTATLTIAKSNILSSFDGDIVLHDDGGTLKLNAADSIRSSPSVTVGSNATLDTAGAAQTLNALYGTGTINTKSATLTINSGSFGGSITNLETDTVVKNTPATLTYTNIEALGSGSTIIQGGVLALRDIAGYTNTSNQKTIVLADGWLDLSDLGSFDPDGDAGANDWTGLNLVNIPGGAGGVIGANDNVTLTGGDDWRIGDGSKNGLYVIIDAGVNTVTLAAGNTYAGLTRLVSGTLDLSGNTQIGDTTLARNVIFDGGNLLVSADVDASARSLDMRADGTLAVADGKQTRWKTLLDGTDSGAAALTKAGSGALFFADAVDYAGAINATGGLLEFLSTAALAELNIATSGTTTFDENSTVADLAVEDAAGIRIAEAKTLTLTATGTIGATTVQGATATLVNQGALSAAAAHIEGSLDNALAATGTVKSIGQNLHNAGLLTIVSGTVGGTTAFNTGTITGAATGILATNANVLVTNTGAGLIQGTAHGVHLTAGGTVTNDGTIRGANDSSRGVYATAIATVTNNSGGLIEGGYEGVDLNAGGTVANSGTIRGANIGSRGVSAYAIATVANNLGGLIEGGYEGVNLFAGGTVVNDGIIRGYDSAGDGVYSYNASSDITVTNNSTGLIEGNWIGIEMFGTYATLTVLNSGTIRGLTESGIYATGRAIVTNTTAGIVSGAEGFYAIDLTADAANEVHLWNSSTLDGDLRIAGASSLLTLNGDHAGAQLYSDAVTGATTFTGTLLKLGEGTWWLDRDMAMGTTDVQAGALIVDWDITTLNNARLNIETGALAIALATSDAHILNELTGRGEFLLANTNEDNDITYSLDASVGTAFTGTLAIGTYSGAHVTRFVFDDTAEDALVAATLALRAGAETTLDANRSIGGFDLEGGLFIVKANPAAPVTPYKLTVDNFTVSSEGATAAAKIGVDTALLSGITPPMPPGDGLSGNIFDLDVLPPDYKLNERIIVSSTVSGPADGIAFDLVDSNGDALASGTDNTTLTYGQNGIAPVGKNTYGYNAITQNGDLLLNYGLVSIEALHDTESLIIDPRGAADDTLSAKLTGDGAAGFTFTGSRTIVLGHTGNDYTGQTLVTGSATLAAAAGLANVIATSTAVTITAGAAFDLNDTAQKLQNLSGAGAINLRAGALTVANTQTGLVFSGVIDGAGSLTLAANSAWTLTGGNTHTGLTTIAAGAHLQLGNGGSTGILADASPVANSGTLTINRSDDLVYGGTITGAGALIQRGAGTTILTGANNLTGGINVEKGVLQIGQNDATGWIPAIASNAAIAAGAELRINRSDLVTYSGVISGAGDFSAIGTGTTVLAKAQTLTGATRVENGTLRLTAANAISTSSGVTLTNATLDLANFAQTLKALNGNNGVIRYHTIGTNDTTYNTLTIGGNYTGSTLSYMNVDLINRRTDFLQINGTAAGTHEVKFRSTNDTPLDDPERKYALEVIRTGAGSTATFSSNGLESGMHTYQLYQGDGGLIMPGKTSWYLSGGDARSRAADAILLTAGLMGADWHYTLDSVHKRLGDIRADNPADTGSIWARANTHRINATSDLGGSAMQQDTYAITAGADKVLRREKAILAAGAYLGMGHSSRTFDDTRNQYGDGKSSNAGAGLYALWLYDNAWYLDATLKFDRNSHELNARGVDGFVSRGKYTTKTQGISLEAGRRLAKGRYWIEPGAQVAVAWINGADYTVSNGVSRDLDIHVGDSDAWQYRGLFRAGADLGQWRPYAKFAIVKSDTNGGEVTADGRRYEPWFDGWRHEAGAGVGYLIDARSQVYLDYEYAKARHYERPWSLNLGYRRAW